MATQNTQIIPSTELTGIETAIGELSVQTSLLPELKRQAQEIQVKDEDSYTQAGLLRKQVKSVGESGEMKLQPFIKKLKDASDFFRTLLNQHKNGAEEITGVLSRKMSDYLSEQERKRREEERLENERRQKEAQAKADADRLAAAAEAERVRKANEKNIKEAVKSGEVSKTEAKQLLKESEKQVETIKQEAEQKAQATETVAPVKVKSNVPTVAGMNRRSVWTFKVKDVDKIPRSYMVPDEEAIGRIVRGLKDKAKTEKMIPGIEVMEEIKV